jgi:hypothetical protein
MKNFLKTFFVQIFLFFPLFVFGQGFGQAPVPLNIASPVNSGANILNIVNYVLGFIGAIVIAYLIYGVFRYLTASGNEDQLKESKSTMTGALISIFAIGLSAALINFVANAISGNLNSGSL